MITRNTIGSPVAELRTGPYGSFGHTGPASEPPFGKGSLGIEVASGNPVTEKVAYGNEVDFFGDPVLSINQIGFQVFDTGENTTYGGGTANLPNITLQIDPNLNAVPNNYTSMVSNPAPFNSADLDQWSPYLDATTTGGWYFTNGAVAGATAAPRRRCARSHSSRPALNDGGTAPTHRHARGRQGPRQHVDRCGRRPAAQRQGLRLRG